MEHAMPETGIRWKNILLFLGGGTLAFMALSIGLNYLFLFSDTLTPFGRSMMAAVILPVVIGLPLLTWVMALKRQIRFHQSQTNYLATHDQLTGLPYGGAFSSIVDRREKSSLAENGASGAFLIIRAKVPDNRFAECGFHMSDDIISLTAATIVSAVRSTDVVGRIGPDLFAVLLWGADEQEARKVGQRICDNAGQVQLAVDAPAGTLDVSAGAVLFEGEPDVNQLFREVSGQLFRKDEQITVPFFLSKEGSPMKVVRH